MIKNIDKHIEIICLLTLAQPQMRLCFFKIKNRLDIIFYSFEMVCYYPILGGLIGYLLMQMIVYRYMILMFIIHVNIRDLFACLYLLTAMAYYKIWEMYLHLDEYTDWIGVVVGLLVGTLLSCC